MQRGTMAVAFEDNGSGGLTGQVWFQPEGGADAYPVGAPQDIAAGQTLAIAPACVECELQTTVETGGSDYRQPEKAGDNSDKSGRTTEARKPAEERGGRPVHRKA